MYAFIEGSLDKITPAYTVLNCNGLGFHLNITVYTYEKIKTLSHCRLLVHQVIAEDHHTLYGFFTEKERDVFRQLISVSGVGANTARVLLSSLNEESVIQAIIRKDAALLQSVKGIGPKAAQRIILELYDKFGKLNPAATGLLPPEASAFEEALQAMQALGFARAVAEKALLRVNKELGEDTSTENLVKNAFKYL